MKKSLKILTLVLSLALICGALVVAAFAADTEVAGITVLKSTDFSGSAFADNGTGIITDGFKWNEPSVGNYGVKTDDDGNNYFYWDGTPTGVAGYNKYLTVTPTSLVIANYDMENKTHKQSGTLDKYDHVVEFDIFTPTGKYEANSFVKIMVFGWDPDFRMSSGSYCSNLNVEMALKTNSNGVSSLNWGGESVKLDKDAWSHITVAITSEIVADDKGDYLDLTATIWVNDVMMISKNHGDTTDPNVGGQKSIDPNKADGYDRLTSYVLGEVRFQPQSTNKADTTADISYAVDNITVQQIEKATYNGNLWEVIENGGKVSDWESNNYDRTKMVYGKTVVTNTTTGIEYDSLQYAIDCAEEGDELELVANVITDVIVDKTLYIAKNGFTAGVVEATKGFDCIEGDDGWQIEESAAPVEISWALCTCGLDSCDETHPGDVITEVGIGGNIFKTYDMATGWSVQDGLTVYTLVGWEDEEGNVYDETSIMTLELAEACGNLLELYPIIDVSSPAFKYEKGGKVIYGFADKTTLKDVITAADAGSVVTILSDLAFVDGANISISKELTIDFGGKTIVSHTKSSKTHLFKLGSKADVTFMTSEPGAQIFHGHDNGTTGTAKFTGNAIFAVENADATALRINGEGLTTYSTVLVYYSYDISKTCDLYIDGGTYVRPASIADNGGLFQLSAFSYVSLKNATFFSENATKCLFAFWGNHFLATPEEKSVVEIDNCNLIAPNVTTTSFDMLEVTITNSLIAGNIANLGCQAKSTWAGAVRDNVPGGTWIIGEGCTVASDAKLESNDDVTVKCADGYTFMPATGTKNVHLTTNTFTTGDMAATKVLTDVDRTVTIDKKVIKEVAPITINWIDAQGNSLGTTEAKPGTLAISPVVSTVADGWVNVSYSAEIPADATGPYTVTVDENTAVKYTAGKVPVYMNYDLVMHFQLNLYIPAEAPEGVTNVAYTRGGTARTFNFNASWVIDGEKMAVGNEWPGAQGADNDYAVTVTYEYNGQAIVYELPAFNMGDYAKVIIGGDYSTEEKQAMLATLNYVDAANKAASPAQTTGTDVTEAIALAAEKGIAVENVTIDTTLADNDYSGISEYITSARLGLGSGITIYLTKSEKALTEGVTLRFTAESGNPYVDKSGTTVSTWYWNNTRAYQLNDNVKIEVLATDGSVVASCDYSVWANAAAIWELPETTDAMKTLVIAALTMGKYVEYIV